MAAIIDVATITALGYIFQKFADFFYNLENKSVVPYVSTSTRWRHAPKEAASRLLILYLQSRYKQLYARD